MIFHRFIAGDVVDREQLEIMINGTRVDAWDPFALHEAATQTLPGTDILVESPGGSDLVRFQPFVLPSRESFSTDEAFHAAAGPRRWNAQQGFYIYRANRMIQSGGWSRMRALDEHVKLARASIDFYPQVDAAFEVNVAKARVALPQELREQIQSGVEGLVRSAQAAYRGHSTASPGETPSAAEPSPRESRVALERAARSLGKTGALKRIAARLKETDPEIAESLGWR
jgi:hypothetical protein